MPALPEGGGGGGGGGVGGTASGGRSGYGYGIPRVDSDLETWCSNFISRYTSVPKGLNTLYPVAAISTAAGEFSDALLTASAPNSRTPVTVSQKNIKKAALVALLRPVARALDNQFRGGLITGSEMLDYGLRVPDTAPSRVTRGSVTAPTGIVSNVDQFGFSISASGALVLDGSTWVDVIISATGYPVTDDSESQIWIRRFYLTGPDAGTTVDFVTDAYRLPKQLAAGKIRLSLFMKTQSGLTSASSAPVLVTFPEVG
jgi:hypothetical protein